MKIWNLHITYKPLIKFHFPRKIRKFSKNVRKYVFGKLFEILKNIFVRVFFFVTRYGYVLCKIHDLGNLQVIQQRTVRYTFKISRILTDEKSLSLALFHRFSYYIIQPPIRVFSFSEQLFWLWSNWSHGSRGRTSDFFCFPSVPYIVIIRKNCLGPVAGVLVVVNFYNFFASRKFPRIASTYLESVT